MKIRLTRSYTTYEVYDDLEIDPNDFPELEGMTEEEMLDYINENMYEMSMPNGFEETIHDEANFNRDIIRDKIYDEEEKFVIAE